MADGCWDMGGDVWADTYHPWAASRSNLAERLFLMGVMTSMQTLCREHQFYIERLLVITDRTINAEAPTARSIRFLDGTDEHNEFIFQLSNDSLMPPQYMLDFRVDLARGTIEHSYRKKYDLGVGPDRYMSWAVINSSMRYFFESYIKATDPNENGIHGRVRRMFKKRPARP